MGKKSLKLSKIYPLLLLLLFAGGLGACLPDQPVPGEEDGEFEPGADGVLAAMVTSRDVPMIFKSRGEIVPSNLIKIRANAPGMVSKVLVREGQKIAAGTTVIRFDTELPQLKLELAQAEAEEADAAIDFEQYRMDNRDQLLDDEEISSAVYDYIERHLEFERTRSKRAKAEVAYLQNLVRAQDIVSSIAGTVVDRQVADQMPVVEGQFLMEIIQDNPVKLLVRLPEEYVPATYRGQLLQVKFPDEERGEETVKIAEVGVSVDPLTRTFDVFSNLDNEDGRLKAGMELETTLVTDKRTTIIAIPKSAVVLRDNKAVVFRILDGIAQQAQVRLGQPTGSEVAVLSGVNEGDIIVVDPTPEMRDGDEVEILTAVAQPVPDLEKELEEAVRGRAVPPAAAPPARERPRARTPGLDRANFRNRFQFGAEQREELRARRERAREERAAAAEEAEIEAEIEAELEEEEMVEEEGYEDLP